MNETIEMKETIEAPEAEKPYTFRKLGAADIVPMTKIIKNIGLKEFRTFLEGDGINKIMAMFSPKSADEAADEAAAPTDEKSIEAIGLSLALEVAEIVFSNLEKCENDIFAFLASVAEMEVEDVRKLDLATFAEMVIDFFKKEEFKGFFKVVSRSFK
jgi:hypothetical protein